MWPDDWRPLSATLDSDPNDHLLHLLLRRNGLSAWRTCIGDGFLRHRRTLGRMDGMRHPGYLRLFSGGNVLRFLTPFSAEPTLYFIFWSVFGFFREPSSAIKDIGRPKGRSLCCYGPLFRSCFSHSIPTTQYILLIFLLRSSHRQSGEHDDTERASAAAGICLPCWRCSSPFHLMIGEATYFHHEIRETIGDVAVPEHC
jgi:hypothetical protein